MSFPLCLPCTHSLHGHVSRPLSSGLYAVHARQPSPRLWELGYRFVTKNYESRVSYDHLALWEWGYRTATKMQNHRMQSKDSLLLRTNGVCIACIATSGLGTGTEWLINIQTIKFLISFYKQDPEQQHAKNDVSVLTRARQLWPCFRIKHRTSYADCTWRAGMLERVQTIQRFCVGTPHASEFRKAVWTFRGRFTNLSLNRDCHSLVERERLLDVHGSYITFRSSLYKSDRVLGSVDVVCVFFLY